MMTWKKIQGYIRSKWIKIRLQPIHVYCLHHVTEVFNSDQMHKCDWIQMDKFKKMVLTMQNDGVEYISLTEAYRHITNDKWRTQRYAALTFDDGWASTLEILPWLCEQQIPVTLFLNPAYIKGNEKREIGASMTQEELNELMKFANGLITIASHGWNHMLCAELSMSEFEKNVNRSDAFLSQYSEYIPFFAYPCGRKTNQQDDYLLSRNIVPVNMDGAANYSDSTVIHREILS